MSGSGSGQVCLPSPRFRLSRSVSFSRSRAFFFKTSSSASCSGSRSSAKKSLPRPLDIVPPWEEIIEVFADIGRNQQPHRTALAGPFLVGEERRLLAGAVLIVVNGNHEVAHALGQFQTFNAGGAECRPAGQIEQLHCLAVLSIPSPITSARRWS